MALPSKPFLYEVAGLKYTAEQIRTMGIGENFFALNPEDGYRKDNRLWFGECSECGERVTSSYVDGVIWKHTGEISSQFGGTTTRSIDYCPSNPFG